MPVTNWLIRHDGKDYGANAGGIIPASLAKTIAAKNGDLRHTYYGKPYVVSVDDPQSVYDYFDSEIDRSGDRETIVWDYTPNPGEPEPGVAY